MMFLIRADRDDNLYDASITKTLAVDEGMEMLATAPRQPKGFAGRMWEVPLNGTLYYLDVNSATKVRPSNLSVSVADEENTCLFTCYWCGGWLKPEDEGYGTRYGWCGCEEK